MVKSDDTTCLARSIVTAMANLHPEKWTKTQLQDGFNKSRNLQKKQALKLHEEAQVEINDYGNNLSDIETFAKHLGIASSNNIIYTANKGHEDKIYLLKTRNHFDVIKSLTAFYDTPYYCHECKKAYTKRDKHKCPSKCLSCFTYAKDKTCEGNEITCKKCNRKFFGKRCLKNHLKNRSKVEGKIDIVCDTVKKCSDCNRIITGKYVNSHKCGYSECKIGVIHVEPTQRNTYFMTSKQPKTPEPTPLTSQLHKTSVVESTYTTVLRISVKAS